MRVEERASNAQSSKEIVVFWIVRDSACAECGEELGKGRFLQMESQRPLCLACADLDHLVVSRSDARAEIGGDVLERLERWRRR